MKDMSVKLNIKKSIVFISLLLSGTAWACHEHNLKGIKGKCMEDMTYDEMKAYLKKIEDLSDRHEDYMEIGGVKYYGV